MNKTFISVLAVAALALAGCSDDDDGGGLSEAQQTAADQAVAQGAEADMEIDQACVEDLASQLTEQDAQAIVDAGIDGDAELSAEGETLTADLFNCIDESAIIDLFIQGIEEAGQEVDDECVHDALEGVDMSTLVDSGEPPAEVVEAVLGCVEI